MGATATRSSTGGTVIAVLAVAALLGVVTANMRKPDTKDRDDEETVVLSLTFTPDRQAFPIHVLAHVNENKVAEELVVHSPWSLVIQIPKGAQVSMHAMHALQEQRGQMDCRIVRNGIEVAHNARADEGSIRCWLNRK